MIGIQQVPPGTWEQSRDLLNAILWRLQQGSLSVSGLKLDRSRMSAPTTAPGTQDPNLVLVDVAGVWTLYHWDGSAWVVV